MSKERWIIGLATILAIGMGFLSDGLPGNAAAASARMKKRKIKVRE